MPERPANQNFNNALTGMVPGAALETIYQQVIDTSFIQFGRNVTFYLEPGRSIPNVNSAMFNPFTGSQDPRLDNSTVFTGNKGAELTPVWVVYRAHVKHGPTQISNSEPFQINANEVMLTTVYTSLDDINLATEIDVDGLRFIKSWGPRPIGFSTPKYVISVWHRKVDGA